MHPKNVPAEKRERERPDGTQPIAQSDECWTSWVCEMLNRLSSFILYKYEHNKPEKESAIHHAINFQKQVQIEDTKGKWNSNKYSPNKCKKDKINI